MREDSDQSVSLRSLMKAFALRRMSHQDVAHILNGMLVLSFSGRKCRKTYLYVEGFFLQ